ncbi:hypothetical protein N7468_000625 [Penicillium chermesinum]|uniref:Uncharacterized protein n=1 Tax=Penicillium chermesinum TaxID=63820 RepID=A0A9W9PNP0_9EURO|nr:uncharacterized protein N7468_000625 [Penicillium chermesinum]KAJ5249174.1 hypothetical protein N7468_000625 [Penicillium chermesinum]
MKLLPTSSGLSTRAGYPGINFEIEVKIEFASTFAHTDKVAFPKSRSNVNTVKSIPARIVPSRRFAAAAVSPGYNLSTPS